MAGTAALNLSDLPALEALVVKGRGAGLADVLRKTSQQLPETQRSVLLLSAIQHASAENAALAIALLAPGLSADAAVTQTLFELLADNSLGSAAALALARNPNPEVAAQQQHLAATADATKTNTQNTIQSEGARRARMAVEMRKLQTPTPASPGTTQ